MNDLIPTQEQNTIIESMAKKAIQSKFCEKIGGESAVHTIMLYARELGLPPLQCVFGGINIIQGKVEISPRLMNAMIRRAGHKLQTQVCDTQKCVITGTRKDTGESLTVTFSIEDAKRAGIFKGAWSTYPDDMCFKSALSKLARRLFPDVISTSYIEGEIAEDTNNAPSTEVINTIVEGSTPVAETVVEANESLISPEKAKILEDSLIGNPDILDRILKAYKIESLAMLKEKNFASVKQRLEEIFT